MVIVKPIRQTVVTDTEIIRDIVHESSSLPTAKAIQKNIELKRLLEKVMKK